MAYLYFIDLFDEGVNITIIYNIILFAWPLIISAENVFGRNSDLFTFSL